MMTQIELHHELLSDNSKVFNVDVVQIDGSERTNRIQLFASNYEAAVALADKLEHLIADFTVNSTSHQIDCTT